MINAYENRLLPPTLARTTQKYSFFVPKSFPKNVAPLKKKKKEISSVNPDDDKDFIPSVQKGRRNHSAAKPDSKLVAHSVHREVLTP